MKGLIGLLFLNSCKVVYEKPLNCLSGESEDDTEFNNLSRWFKSSSKVLCFSSYQKFKSSVPQTIKDSLIYAKNST